MIKICGGCGESYSSNGRQEFCGSLKNKKGCCFKKRKEKQKIYLERFKEKNPGYFKNKQRIRKFGISDDEFNIMVKNNGGVCSICKTSEYRLGLDHCHKTRKIRGVLCTMCNFGLGYFMDSHENLSRAVEYLKK